MTERFMANAYNFSGVEVMFAEVDEETDEERRVFWMAGSPGFYMEYGDQGNSCHDDAVARIELSRRQFHIVFKQGVHLVTWESFCWEPEEVKEAVPVSEIVIELGFDAPPEDWAGLCAAMARITGAACEYTCRG